MFVNIVQFPPIKLGKDEAFRNWFRESNSVYQAFDGFISRRLLQPSESEPAAEGPPAATEPHQRLRPGELRARVLEFVHDHASDQLSPTAVARALNTKRLGGRGEQRLGAPGSDRRRGADGGLPSTVLGRSEAPVARASA